MTLVDRRIVKVQISISGNRPERRALVYDKSRQWTFEGPADAALLTQMDGGVKAFFYATIDESGVVNLEAGAPWQIW